VVAAVALFIVLVNTIGRRFKRALGNSDIAFWLSRSGCCRRGGGDPIYVLFQRLQLLDTWPR